MDSDNTDSTHEINQQDHGNHDVSESGFGTRNEQLALMGFAHRLYSVSCNDPSNAEKSDVRKEAKLLMSLSGLPPPSITVNSGRISPPSDASSCHSLSSRQRDSFRFSCPSLSLENWSPAAFREGDCSESSSSSSQKSIESSPAALLGRVLKVDDVDALRLSSEAMARNIMQSYEKAIQWRIQSWVESLSRALLEQEKSLQRESSDSQESLAHLRESAEAMLIVRLNDIREAIEVTDASNFFNVLPQKAHLQQDEPPLKKQRFSGDLEESDYEYSVSHLLTYETVLNIHAPVIGSVAIELKVPGTMNGSFMSFEDGHEEMIDACVDINTDMLASMIEKSSRMVVRSTIEALLQAETSEDDDKEANSEGNASQNKKDETEGMDPAHWKRPSSTLIATPNSIKEHRGTPELMLITPRDRKSSISNEVSDTEDHLVDSLSIPDDLGAGKRRPVLAPNRAGVSPIVREKSLPSVVTPSKSLHSFVEGEGPGPNLPTLVEVALKLQK